MYFSHQRPSEHTPCITGVVPPPPLAYITRAFTFIAQSVFSAAPARRFEPNFGGGARGRPSRMLHRYQITVVLVPLRPALAQHLVSTCELGLQLQSGCFLLSIRGKSS